ncbi:uncharacterized protein [Euwallacea fornicatus]|uniref:uncharacterized protein n=1 Tax=Euwallacea fornicatus TaxID=995702 RepID=UPI00338DF1C9
MAQWRAMLIHSISYNVGCIGVVGLHYFRRFNLDKWEWHVKRMKIPMEATGLLLSYIAPGDTLHHRDAARGTSYARSRWYDFIQTLVFLHSSRNTGHSKLDLFRNSLILEIPLFNVLFFSKFCR